MCARGQTWELNAHTHTHNLVRSCQKRQQSQAKPDTVLSHSKLFIPRRPYSASADSSKISCIQVRSIQNAPFITEIIFFSFNSFLQNKAEKEALYKPQHFRGNASSYFLHATSCNTYATKGNAGTFGHHAEKILSSYFVSKSYIFQLIVVLSLPFCNILWTKQNWNLPAERNFSRIHCHHITPANEAQNISSLDWLQGLQ